MQNIVGDLGLESFAHWDWRSIAHDHSHRLAFAHRKQGRAMESGNRASLKTLVQKVNFHFLKGREILR
jgi:hypothetical protein